MTTARNAPERSDAWKGRRDGYHTCRIPALAVTPAGTLLAFCEGRRHGSGDAGAIDVLARRSTDGGDTWSEQRPDPALVEPICQASIRRHSWPREGEAGAILFSNPASTETRVHLTVRLSRDEGATWPFRRTLHAGPSAYSCLAVLPDGRIACLYKAGDNDPYERITLARLGIDSIEGENGPNKQQEIAVSRPVRRLGDDAVRCSGSHRCTAAGGDRSARRAG